MAQVAGVMVLSNMEDRHNKIVLLARIEEARIQSAGTPRRPDADRDSHAPPASHARQDADWQCDGVVRAR